MSPRTSRSSGAARAAREGPTAERSGTRKSPTGTLAFGIVLAGSGGKTALDTFCASLARAVGCEVTGTLAFTYPRLVEAMDRGEIDLAWLPPVLALQAAAADRVVPLALPIRNGASTYASALFTREASQLRSIESLRGAVVAWVDRQSASGYALARAHLRSTGLDLDRAFREERFFGDHAAVARAVLEGKADVGATFAYLDDGKPPAPIRAGWGKARVRVLALAGPIPSDVMVAGAHVHREVRDRVRAALLGDTGDGWLRNAASELLRAEGFAPVSAKQIETARPLLRWLEETPASTTPSIWPRVS